MTPPSIVPNSRSSSSRLPEHGTRAVARSRIVVALAAFGGFALWLYSSASALTPTPGSVAGGVPSAVAWWSWPIGLVGAALLAVLVATFWASPVGARPTLCDLRWPALGLAGLLLAVGTRAPLGFVATIFGGTPSALLDILQPIVGLASIALILWALRERQAVEARALAPTKDDAEVCQTCRPLY